MGANQFFSYYVRKLLQIPFLLPQRKSDFSKMDTEFPQYRKLINGKSYYVIHSRDRMTEYARLGNRWQRFDLEARILPERNLISDLISGQDGVYLTISEEEFNHTIQ